MKKIEISINGEAYPCTPSMGAMLRFKRETGKEITEIDARSLSELCTYLWCCVVSGSKREGKNFDMSLMDFADAVTPEDMAAWKDAIATDASEAEAAEEKKSM